MAAGLGARGQRFPLEDYIWWVSTEHRDGSKSKKKQRNWWCAACCGQYDLRAPNRVLVIQDSTDSREANVFRAHAAPQGMPENLINSLKLLTNQQKCSDGPVENIVTGFLKQSRRSIMNGLGKFMEVDNHEEVKGEACRKAQHR